MRVRTIRARHVVVGWLVIYFPWLPGWPLRNWLPETPIAYVIDANLAARYALVAISLVVLTGWVGQISLGQGAFVGVGAFTTGMIAREWGIPFPVSLPIVVVVTAAVAATLGMVALRVRGLYLAVATLIFAWMADAYLFSSAWFIGEGGSAALNNRPIGNPEGMIFFDLSEPRVFYLVALAVVAGAWYIATNLRESKTGRAFFAVRGSEMAAVSLGIDIMRYKLLAFAISGGIAGLAGNLWMVEVRAATPAEFAFTTSLFFLGIAVVGGIRSLGGAVAAGILFAALTEVFREVPILDGWLDVVTIGLLLAVLLGYPGGLGALGPVVLAWVRPVTRRVSGRFLSFRDRFAVELRRLRGRDATLVDEAGESDTVTGGAAGDGAARWRTPRWADRLRAWLTRPRSARARLKAARARARAIDVTEATVRPEPTTDEVAARERAATEHDWRTAEVAFALPARRTARTSILEASEITVRFGGLTAVDDVSLDVREQEIVGLIGPNGAGKTTTFNAVAGLNQPAEGRVVLFGEEVTDLPVHMRAQMGMGRTFQLIQLFPELTVFDNLLVATHTQNLTGVVSHVALTKRAIIAELEARDRVRLIVELLGMEDMADRRVAGLPFGVLRQVEVARALVTGSPLLMLDEPASGLDNAETDELAQMLRFLRARLGVSILLIEHDVRMVTGVSDYIYVLNQGRLLAEGTAAEIQANPEVVGAYLGQTVGAEDDDQDHRLPAEAGA